MKRTYDYRNKTISFDLSSSGRTYRATFGEKIVPIELICTDGEWLDLLIDGLPTRAYISRDGIKCWVTVNGQTFELINASEARKSAGHSGQHADHLTAKMPGLVRAVSVAEGDQVIKGQALAVIEAMKMENKVTSPFNGLIKRLMIKIGQTVEREQVLMVIVKNDEAEINASPSID